MGTITDSLNEASKLENTKMFINQMLDQISTESLRVVAGNCMNVDTTVIDAIRDFLQMELDLVQGQIDAIMNCSVSGC